MINFPTVSNRTPVVNTTPAPSRKRASTVDERPSRIGTRVSPRTLQRQTGLTLYKDTSSESEDDEESNQASEASEEPVDDKEEEEEIEEETSEPSVGVVKVAQRKKRGRRAKSRKRPVKKKLQQIVEEPEEVDNKSTVEEQSEMKVEKEDESVVEEDKEVDVKKEIESPDVEKDDFKKDDEMRGSQDDTEKKEHDVKQLSSHSDSETSKMEAEEEETKPTQSEIKEDPKEEKKTPTKTEEEVTSGTTQRFTVSQLLQKLAPAEEPEESLPASEVSSTVEPESKINCIPDPDRASYDPYFFELIISSVEELQEWINRFSDPNEDDKPRPRCEIKLREHLQSLLEEAQPLASDQQQANQKISQQLWKEWERYRCSSSNPRQSADVADQNDQIQESGASDSDETEPEDSSGGSDDGVRHSRRLRVKRNLHTANGSHQSTRSSSPMDEEPVTKQNRKGSYNFDPSWDSDPYATPETPVGRKRSNYVPEMKNPGFWVGRRVTRATAEFVGVPEESASPPQQPQNNQPVTSSVEKSPPQGVQSVQLADQLRQLRRQQALLSSNDPRPSGSSVNSPNCSPVVYLPSKDGQLIRITNPKTAGFLTQLKVSRPLQSATPSPIAAQPRKILIQQRPPLHLQKPGGSPAAPVSIDITQLVSQAVQNGLIVAHEPRSLSLDMGQHGHFMVTAQMTPTGPKVISAQPLPRKVRIMTNVVAPESTPVVLPSPDSAPKDPAVLELTSATPTYSESAPMVSAESADPTTLVSHDLNPPVVPASIVSTTTTTDVTTPPTESIPPVVTSPFVTAATTPKANGSPAISKQILINDPRQNSIISADILRSVAGPEAVGARLTIVKEGNTKMLTLILSNGEIRRLTNSQVQQIQTAVRNKTKPSTDEGATS